MGEASENQTAGAMLVDRQASMRVLAMATRADLEEALALFEGQPLVTDLRKPEVGLVMLRGCIGGTGAPFNLGEATVSRAFVQLPTGQKGYAMVLGRDVAKARAAAVIDGMWQDPALQGRVEAAILAPLRARQAAADHHRAGQAAATKVDFFTLVRGED